MMKVSCRCSIKPPLCNIYFRICSTRLLAGCFCSGNIGLCLLACLLQAVLLPRGQAIGEGEERMDSMIADYCC